MQFEFTELNYKNDYRFGGQLEISAENAQEVESLISHFRLFKDLSDVETLKARIAALEAGKLSHVIKSDKRPVYEVSSCLEHEFTMPYKEWALRNFGYDGTFPDLDIPRERGGLIYTNYQARLYTDNEHICFDAFTTSEPWNKKDAHDHAQSRVVDYIGEEFGTRHNEPEFIQAGNNHVKRNPDYLKRHKATPRASNARLKRAFFEWWITTHASDAQKAIVAGNREIVAQTGTYMGAFEFERDQDRIYYGRKVSADGKTKDYKSMTFAEFGGLI